MESKYGCRYFLLHLGLMVVTFTYFGVWFGLYEITVRNSWVLFCDKSFSCLFQFIPTEPVRKFMESLGYY